MRHYWSGLGLLLIFGAAGLIGLVILVDYIRQGLVTPPVRQAPVQLASATAVIFRPQVYPATLTPVSEATRWPTATRYGTVCACQANLLDCYDFDDQDAAQRCYDYCLAQQAGDIHLLDQDKDGKACEMR